MRGGARGRRGGERYRAHDTRVCDPHSLAGLVRQPELGHVAPRVVHAHAWLFSRLSEPIPVRRSVRRTGKGSAVWCCGQDVELDVDVRMIKTEVLRLLLRLCLLLCASWVIWLPATVTVQLSDKACCRGVLLLTPLHHTPSLLRYYGRTQYYLLL